MSPLPPLSGFQGSASRLLAAALEVFNETGVYAASIHDICARAGVSIGSAYHHFGSKQGLADALLVEGLRDNARALRARLQRCRDAEASVRALVGSLIDWIDAHLDWAHFIYTVADTPRGGAPDRLGEFNAEYRALIDTRFGPYLRSGALRRLPPELYAPLILGPVHDYARRVLSGRARGPLAKHRKAFADSAWLAVRAERRAARK
jgi:AcrR family transcriptional regulator